MAKTITFDLPEQSEIALSDGRVIGLRGSPRVGGGTTAWAARRPGWGDARRAAEERIVDWTRPRMSDAEIRALGERDRRRVMLAIVRAADVEADWRALYGTSLSRDERFVAVMRWSRERELMELRESLSATRRRLVSQADEAARAASESVLAATRPRDLGLLANTAALAKVGAPSGLAGFAGIADGLTVQLGRAQSGIGLAQAAKQAILPDLGTAYPLLTGSTAAGGAARLAGFGALSEPRDFGQIAAMSEGLAGLAAGPSPLESMKLNESSALKAAMEPLGIGPGGPLASASAIAEQMTGRFAMRELIDGTLAGGRFDAGFGKGLGLAALEFGYGLGAEALGLGKLGLDLPKLDPWPGLGEQLRRNYEGLIVVEYARTWANDPLWFLLEFFSPTDLPQLLGRREAVYQAVLDGLEVVVCQSDLVPELTAALAELPFLTEIQREWLLFGLAHAQEGEWTQAVANLFTGFEGALHSAAVAAERIDSGREGKLIGAEAIIKTFELSEDLEAFAIRLAFGGRGNAFRHGRPRDAARDQVLLVVVALIGWVDSVIGTDGTGALVAELRGPLRQAIERDRSGPSD